MVSRGACNLHISRSLLNDRACAHSNFHAQGAHPRLIAERDPFSSASRPSIPLRTCCIPTSITMSSHQLSQAVRDHQLTARIGKSPRYVIHDIRDARLPPSAPPSPQTWKSDKKPIGKGGQGRVFLQKCIGGAQTHDATERAVKVIPYQSHDEKQRYRRELETLVRFSHQRVTIIWPPSANVRKREGSQVLTNLG